MFCLMWTPTRMSRPDRHNEIKLNLLTGLPVGDCDDGFDSALQLYFAYTSEMLPARQRLCLIYDELFLFAPAGDNHGDVRGPGLVYRIGHRSSIFTGLWCLESERCCGFAVAFCAVNRQKSSIRRTDGVEFLGFVFQGYGGQIRVSEEPGKVSRPRPRDHRSQPRRFVYASRTRTPPLLPPCPLISVVPWYVPPKA